MIRTVKASGTTTPLSQFEAAQSASGPNDIIEIEAGTVLTTPGLEQPALILNKSFPPDAPLTIRAAVTVSPLRAQSPTQIRALNLPKIVSNTSTPAVEAVAGSSGYRLSGLEITNDSKNKTMVNNALVMAGITHGSSPRLTLATVPKDIEFNSCWVHGEEDGTDSEIASCVRGFMLGASDFRVINSRVGGFRAFYPWGIGQPGASSQAVLIEKGPGPYTIKNCYLEAWFTSIFTGGGPQWITNEATISNASISQATFSNVLNLKVGDYVALRVVNQGSKYQVARVTEINGNVVKYVPQGGLPNTDRPTELTGNPLLVSPESPGHVVWNGDLPRGLQVLNNTFFKNAVVGAKVAESNFYGKGHIEIKTAENALFEGNDYSGYSAGFTITSRNQSDEATSGNNPWATIKNVMFRNSRWRGEVRPGKGALIGIQLNDNMNTTVQGHHVTFENFVFEKPWTMLINIGGSDDVTFKNVQAVGGIPQGEDAMIGGHSGPNNRFQLLNSIVQNNEYGMTWSTPTDGFPNKVIQGNVILDNRSAAKKTSDGPLAQFYPGNLTAQTLAEIQLTADGLVASSPFKGKGTDGKDPGVDYPRLLTSMGGTIEPPPVDNPPPPPPPIDPPPPPTTSTPSPDGTKGVTVTDSTNGVWTLSDKKTLRNNIHQGGGLGSVYKFVGGIVYVLGVDNNWYKWINSGWAMYGPTEPGSVIVPPPPPPVDTSPVVGSLKKGVAWTVSETADNAEAKRQRALGYYFHSHETGKKATFVYTGVKIST